MEIKRYRELERIMKGIANYRRIQILDMLDTQTELSVMDVAEKVKADFRTIGEHLRKLAIAGLVMKRYEGASVRHALTNRGKKILMFCRTLV